MATMRRLYREAPGSNGGTSKCRGFLWSVVALDQTAVDVPDIDTAMRCDMFLPMALFAVDILAVTYSYDDQRTAVQMQVDRHVHSGPHEVTELTGVTPADITGHGAVGGQAVQRLFPLGAWRNSPSVAEGPSHQLVVA